MYCLASELLFETYKNGLTKVFVGLVIELHSYTLQSAIRTVMYTTRGWSDDIPLLSELAQKRELTGP